MELREFFFKIAIRKELKIEEIVVDLIQEINSCCCWLFSVKKQGSEYFKFEIAKEWFIFVEKFVFFVKKHVPYFTLVEEFKFQVF
jgi:hypothetical protein